jgi:hypothetical protein
LPVDIESIRVVDSTRYNDLKGYDETTVSEIDFNISSRGFNIRPRRLKTCAWFPFYYEDNILDLSRYQIFSLKQLINEGISTNDCFVNCLKCSLLNPDTIESAKEIIRDLLTPKHLNKICSAKR